MRLVVAVTELNLMMGVNSKNKCLIQQYEDKLKTHADAARDYKFVD